MLFRKSVTRSASSLAATRPVRRLATAAIGVVGLSLVALQVAPVQTAAAAPSFSYQGGYYLDNGWLCYGWADGAYHCTMYWHRASNGQLISDNTAWVPNSGSTTSTTSTSVTRSAASAPSYSTQSYTPSGISQWANTGRGAWRMYDYAGDPYSGVYGGCTWWAWYKNSWQPLMQLGDAWQWAYNAPSHGLATGSTPAVGATVVFQPGVQGASSLGHAAHVEAVYGGGWFLVSEMSFYWNGGGWGIVSYRYAHTGPGVSFIYA